MYSINKIKQPDSLTTYKRVHDACYSNLPKEVKDDLRDYLLREQGYVCAYCMNRVKSDTMRIEHWKCQDDNDELGLDYDNLLACCDGNENQQKHYHICDKKKANKILSYCPSKPEHAINNRIKYNHGAGKIFSDDEKFDTELNEVLNLNEARLTRNRLSALGAVQEELSKKKGTRSKQDIQKLLNWVMDVNKKNEKKPFFGFLGDYLSKKL